MLEKLSPEKIKKSAYTKDDIGRLEQIDENLVDLIFYPFS